MKKEINKKLFILMLVFFISIGFAYLSTNMKLLGTGIFKENSWDIYFDNIDEETFKSTFVTATNIESKTTINCSINLEQPQSTYTLYTDIVNDGTIDAMLDSFTVSNTMDTDEAAVIDIKITYADGVDLNKYDLLKANSFDTIKMIVTYKSDISNSELLEADGSLDITLTLNYMQSDEDSVEREHRLIVMFPACSTLSYDRNTGITTGTVIGLYGYWEKFYTKLHLQNNSSYKINLEYNIPVDYVRLRDPFDGIGVQILNEFPSNSNCLPNALHNEFMNTTAGKDTITFEFTARENNYFVIDGGYAADNKYSEFQILSLSITKLN